MKKLILILALSTSITSLAKGLNSGVWTFTNLLPDGKRSTELFLTKSSDSKTDNAYYNVAVSNLKKDNFIGMVRHKNNLVLLRTINDGHDSFEHMYFVILKEDNGIIHLGATQVDFSDPKKPTIKPDPSKGEVATLEANVK